METGSVSSYAQLRGGGATRRQIDRAVQAGTIRRIAPGWYAMPGADDRIVRAIQAGGRAGCLTGCALHGLWTPPGTGLHVVLGAGLALPPTRGLQLHPSASPQPREAVWPLLDCLSHVVHRHSTEDALIVLESALHLGLVTTGEVSAVLATHHKRGTVIRRHLAVAESGSETRVRHFLAARGVAVSPQVWISGVGRVDLLVGKRLILECDSRTFHASTETYETDRARDLAARDKGFDTLRLSYRQVWREWPATRESLIRHIRRGAHRADARP